jgi:hypothetical protein
LAGLRLTQLAQSVLVEQVVTLQQFLAVMVAELFMVDY